MLPVLHVTFSRMAGTTVSIRQRPATAATSKGYFLGLPEVAWLEKSDSGHAGSWQGRHGRSPWLGNARQTFGRKPSAAAAKKVQGIPLCITRDRALHKSYASCWQET